MSAARRTATLLAAAALAGLALQPASAATLTYTLDQVSANGASGALAADDVPYAQVTVEDDLANNQIDFTFELLGNVDAFKLAGGGIKSVAFNVDAPLSYTGTSLTGKGVTNIASGFTVPSDRSMNGFGVFDFKLDRTGSAGRLDPLTFSLDKGNALWSGFTAANFFDLSGGSASQGNVAFAVGVTGISSAGFAGGNPFFGGGEMAPVPLPGAAWLLLSGLGALGGAGAWRRRRASAAAAG